MKHKEYDIQNREAIEYYKTLDDKELDKLMQIALSNNSLSVKQILDAKECYLFGDKILYIIVDKDSDVFVFNLESKNWSKRSSDSFWDSWDLDPTVFIRISSDEAIRTIDYEGYNAFKAEVF